MVILVKKRQARIRLLDFEDASTLARLVQSNADYLRPWEPARDARFYTEEGQLRLARSLLEAHERGTTVPFVIEHEDGTVLGRLTLNGVIRGAFQSCALSYWVRAAYAGQGHATRAVLDAVDYAFLELALHRVQAETLLDNEASQRVLQKTGFQQFGVAKNYLCINGKWRDHMLFSALILGSDAPSYFWVV